LYEFSDPHKSSPVPWVGELTNLFKISEVLPLTFPAYLSEFTGYTPLNTEDCCSLNMILGYSGEFSKYSKP
jgi:hypothetical protein